MSNEVMDIDGLAKYLKLAPVTLYKMVKEGRVPCRRIGKSLRFPKVLIDDWLLNESHEVESTVPKKIKKVVSEFAVRVRNKMGVRIKNIRLYGSWARNEARSDSDIDLVVIVNKKDLNISRTLREIAASLSLEYDLFLSVVIIEESTHEKGKNLGYLFHRKIEEEGIPI